MPDDVDPAEFILTDGRRSKKLSTLSELRTLKQLLDRYNSTIPEGAKEPSTRKTERIHLKHLRRILKTSQALNVITVAVLQQYVDKRLRNRLATGRSNLTPSRRRLPHSEPSGIGQQTNNSQSPVRQLGDWFTLSGTKNFRS